MAYVDQIFEQAGRLGAEVDEPLRTARNWLGRADELNRQLEAARASEEAEYPALVEALAAAKLTPAEAAAKASGRWVFDSPASKLIVAAVATCHANASATSKAAGPKIFTALQRRVAGVVAESAKLAATLPAWVDSDRSAFAASKGSTTSHYETWERLRWLVDDWTHCFDLLLVMQRAQWVDGPAHTRDREGARLFERYQRPLSLPPGYWQGPGELRLAKAAASNAAPGMYGWSDAVARWQRIDRTQRNYGQMEVVAQYDSMGNVVASEASPERPYAFAPQPVAG